MITWYKDGRQLPSTGRGPSEMLIVNNVGREDRGMYQCVVRRTEGDTAQAAAELQLGGKFNNNTNKSYYFKRGYLKQSRYCFLSFKLITVRRNNGKRLSLGFTSRLFNSLFNITNSALCIPPGKLLILIPGITLEIRFGIVVLIP